MTRRRTSLATITVLQALSRGYRYGFDIIDATGLPSGTVYPILGRLEEDGRVVSSWEDPEIGRREKRPPRRYYRITRRGDDLLEEALERYRAVQELAPADTADEPA